MFSDRFECKLTVILVSLNDAKFIAMCGSLQVPTYKVRPFVNCSGRLELQGNSIQRPMNASEVWAGLWSTVFSLPDGFKRILVWIIPTISLA